MKAINNKYILLKKVQEEEKEGFQAVAIQDSFVFKGQVHRLPECPMYIDNHQLNIGDIVIFTRVSPDTHEIDVEGEKMKMVKLEDVLTVI